MTCQEVRAALLMREIASIDADAAIAEHIAGCPRCSTDVARVRTATVATAERLDGWSSMADPMALAERSIDQATGWRETRQHRWRVAWVSACAVAITAWVLLTSGRTAALRTALGFGDPPYTTMVVLECVSPQEAAALALPYLHARGSDARPSVAGVASVTLTGLRAEVAEAEVAIARLDGKLGAPRPLTCSR